MSQINNYKYTFGGTFQERERAWEQRSYLITQGQRRGAVSEIQEVGARTGSTFTHHLFASDSMVLLLQIWILLTE